MESGPGSVTRAGELKNMFFFHSFFLSLLNILLGGHEPISIFLIFFLHFEWHIFPTFFFHNHERNSKNMCFVVHMYFDC